MSRRLIAHVHIDGVTYGPGSTVPPKVAKRIGDHAWTSDADQDAPAEIASPAGAMQSAGQPVGDGSGSDIEAPPRSGRGSGVEAWRAFAEQHEVEVAADASREDIIAACEAAELIEREE